MIRTETYLDGHLVKEFDMVNIGPSAEKPYDDWIDGRYRWLLDGAEITQSQAEELLAAGEAGAWLASDGTCWLHFPQFAEFHGWQPGRMACSS